MSKKKKQSATGNTQASRRREKNEFLKNHPFAYFVVAILAFVLGNCLFDYIGQFF